MRIDRFDLIAYGHFTDTHLDLSQGREGLHLIYGDNEAGKSTALRALIAWLFGIPVRTGDNFLHSHSQLRIGGRLRMRDGSVLEFVRRKGRQHTILDPENGRPINENVLGRVLGGMDEERFRKFYGIDHERLKSGAMELLQGSGGLGPALLSAATGTTQWNRVLRQLRSEAEGIFSPRGSTKALNKAIKDYEQAIKDVKSARLPVSRWKELQKQVNASKQELSKVEADINEKNKVYTRLNRMKLVLPPLRERETLVEQLRLLEDVVDLPEDFYDQVREVEAARENARVVIERAQQAIKQVEGQIAGLRVRRELLEHKDEIQQLYRALGAVEKAIADRPSQVAKRSEHKNQARILLKETGPEYHMEDAPKLRPFLNRKDWLQELFEKYGLMQQELKSAMEDRQGFIHEVDELQVRLDELSGSARDMKGLKEVLKRVNKAGDIEERLGGLQKRVKKQKKSLEEAFKRLGRYGGNIEGLMTTPMPEPAMVERFDEDFRGVAEKTRDLERRIQETGDEVTRLEEELNLLVKTREVFSIDDLKAVRGERDRWWLVIRRTYIDGTTDGSGTGDGRVDEIYEGLVRRSDEIADHMRENADLVSRRMQLEARVSDLKMRLGRLKEEMENTDKRRGRLNEAWQAVWRTLGITPGTPREMKQWMERANRLIEQADDLNLLVQEAGDTSNRLKELKQMLVSAASEFTKTDGRMTLGELVEFSEQLIQTEEDRRKEIISLERAIRDRRARIDRKKDEIEAIKGRIRAWSDEWKQAVDGLDVPVDAHPRVALEKTGKLERFFKEYDEAEALGRRIYGIDQVIEDFKRKVSVFAEKTGFEMDGMDALDAVRRMNIELNNSISAQSRLETLEAQRRESEKVLAESRILMKAADVKMAGFRAQAGVEQDAHLRRVYDESMKKQALQRRILDLEAQVIRIGDGMSMDELVREAAKCDPDALIQELQGVNQEIEDLQQRREDIRERINDLRHEEEGYLGNSESAEVAQQRAQALAARITDLAEEYIRLKTAALLLEQKTDEYRKQHQRPVLIRAGQIFSTLTLGAYTGLKDDLDENDRPILLCVRNTGREVPIAGLSDGTRDQLHLALRIASLEQHLSGGEAMPFIVDDIMIGFDDHRTSAGLTVLSELARKTQVLMFTHHKRVMELAEGIGSNDVFIHRLNPQPS